MNAIKYLRNRFEFAAKGNGTIKVNNQDIEAINILIESEKKRNTDLEDSLLLFFLFWTYRIENDKNSIKLKEKGIESIKFPLGLNTPYNILNKLSKLLDPKSVIIENIANEIWVYQEYERCCENQELRDNEIESENYVNDGDFSYLKVTKQNMIPIDKKSTYEEVERIVNEALIKAKNDFPMINALSNGTKWSH